MEVVVLGTEKVGLPGSALSDDSVRVLGAYVCTLMIDTLSILVGGISGDQTQSPWDGQLCALNVVIVGDEMVWPDCLSRLLADEGGKPVRGCITWIVA